MLRSIFIKSLTDSFSQERAIITHPFTSKLSLLITMTPQTNSSSLSKIIERYPHLKTLIEKGLFLTGYTQGGFSGKLVPIFLVRSPWTQFCLQAQAVGVLPPGGVLLITDEAQWSPHSTWQAYSLESEEAAISNNSIHETKAQPNRTKVSPLASTATTIALESHKRFSDRLRKVPQTEFA